LGEWLAQAIATEARTLAAHESQAVRRQQPAPQSVPPAQPRPHSPPADPFLGSAPQAFAARQPEFTAQPQTFSPEAPARTALAQSADVLHAQARNSEFTIVAHGLRDLADRLESSERRQTQAISAIHQNVAAMADKVDAADRIKLMAETAFATATDAINRSARDQSSAFESLETTVRGLSERLKKMESGGQADPVARDAAAKLESAMEAIAARLGEAERRGADAQTSLDAWVKTLTERLETSGEETKGLITSATQSLETSLAHLRSDLGETDRREREKAMAALQASLTALRTEIADTDRRARDMAQGLERWVKDLHGRLDHSDAQNADLTVRLSDGARSFAAADQVQRLNDSVQGLRTEIQAATETMSQAAATRERAAQDAQASLDAAIRRLAHQVSQSELATAAAAKGADELARKLELSEARTGTALATLQSALGEVESRVATAIDAQSSARIDTSLVPLKESIETLTTNLAKSEQSSVQTAQRQAAAVRKVEDMLQGFARGLDTVSDLTNGPLAQPMSAIQATLETITAKIEDGDARSANAIGTMESALKALAARIEDSEKRQAQISSQIESSVQGIAARLDASERRETDREQRLDDSFRDVIDRIEDTERKSADAIDAVESGLSNMTQRLEAADRRQKEAVAGLRLTVDGLVAKAASEPLMQRSAFSAASIQAQPLSASHGALPSSLLPPAPPPQPATFSLAPQPSAPPAIPVPPPIPAPPAFEPAAHAPPPMAEEPPPASPAAPFAFEEPAAPRVQDAAPPVNFDALLERAKPAPAFTPFDMPPEPPAPKKADDFLAQARRAAQQAAVTDAEQQAAQRDRKRGRSSDPYAQQDTGRGFGRLAIVLGACLAAVIGIVALFALLPGGGTGDDPNRPAPGSSLGDVLSPEAQNAAPAPEVGTRPPAGFTELPPAPDTSAPPPLPQSLAPPLPGPDTAAAAPAAQPPAATPLLATAPAPSDPALEARATRGDAKAQYALATRYSEGRLLTRDPAKAAQWFEKAAKAGFAPAQYRMGALYERGGDGVNKDLNQARIWYERAALNGNRKAMHNLAVLHAEGIGVAQSFPEAAKWFKRGAEAGLTDSQFNLAVLYERGLGLGRNPVEAAKWFAIAAAQGDADAAGKLAAIRRTMQPAEVDTALEAARTFQPKTSAAANDTP
jgi:localization factor PodJL